ncbi:MAG TPA: hypothetical protein ACQGQG_09550 [Xylella sp.]
MKPPDLQTIFALISHPLQSHGSIPSRKHIIKAKASHVSRKEDQRAIKKVKNAT